MSFKLEVKGLDATIKTLNKISEDSKKGIQAAVDTFLTTVEHDAIQKVPVDESFLKQSIKIRHGVLEGSVVATADYAAYVEFGTRKFAEKYVATLPKDWQTFAAKFKGKGGGSFEEFVARIAAWMKRKGLEAKVYNAAGNRVRTVKGQSNKQTNEADAYALAIHIMRHGTKAHPFLYPAFTNEKTLERLQKDLEEVFK